MAIRDDCITQDVRHSSTSSHITTGAFKEPFNWGSDCWPSLFRCPTKFNPFFFFLANGKLSPIITCQNVIIGILTITVVHFSTTQIPTCHATVLLFTTAQAVRVCLWDQLWWKRGRPYSAPGYYNWEKVTDHQARTFPAAYFQQKPLPNVLTMVINEDDGCWISPGQKWIC